MAITRSQIAKQLLEQGGRVGLRFGSEGYQGGRTDQGGAGRGTGPERGGGNNGNRFTEFTKENLNPQVDTVTEKFTGRSNLFGGANRFGYTELRPDGSLKPGYGGRIFGGLLSALTGIPIVGSSIGNMYDKGKGFFTPKTKDMSEFNKLGLLTEENDDTTTGNIQDGFLENAQAKVVGLALAQKQNLEKKKRMEDFGGPTFTEEDQKTLDKLNEMDASEETFYQPVQTVADGGRIGLMEGGMPYEGGIMDFESARQMYGLGKLVKKATRAVKKVAQSPIGKAALLYTGAGALGNLAAGTGVGGMFKGFLSPQTFLGKDKLFNIFSREGLKNIAFGKPGEFLGTPRGPNTGIMTKGTSGLFGFGGELSPLKAISATSLLPLLGLGTGAETEEEAQALLDQSGIDMEAIRANPEKFLAQRFRAEEGGRADESPKEGEKGIMKVASNDANERLLEQLFEQFLDEGFSPEEAAKKAREAFYDRDFAGAKGGDVEPVAKKTMPLLDMGGQEMDFRAEGGFVPIGRMEKADDVPARLSKNEFVFTADAVRNAGEGDIDKGAEVMYNMMKNLEAGGEVSEESQGLEGARKMFQTSKRLEEVL